MNEPKILSDSVPSGNCNACLGCAGCGGCGGCAACNACGACAEIDLGAGAINVGLIVLVDAFLGILAVNKAC